MVTLKMLWVVSCALLDADGRVLVAQRPQGKDFGGLWEFPGGKVEKNETPEHALQRELREELMVEPCVDCFEPLGFTTNRSDVRSICLMLFVCRRWDGFVKPTEHSATLWKYPNELAQLDMTPLDRTLISIHAERIHGRRVS